MQSDVRTPADLRNRTLHIRWKEEEQIPELNSSKHQNEVLKISKPQNGVLETPTLTDPKQLEGLGTKLTIKEMVVIKLITENNRISLKELASSPGMSKGTLIGLSNL